MESESAAVGGRNAVRILVRENPSLAGEAEFQFVTIIDGLGGGECGPYFWHLQMAYPDELVVNLSAFRLELHPVRQWLPSAAAAGPEMRAERLQAFGRRFDDFRNETLQVIFLFLCDPDVYDISRNCERDKDDHSVIGMGHGVSFGSYGFD